MASDASVEDQKQAACLVGAGKMVSPPPDGN